MFALIMIAIITTVAFAAGLALFNKVSESEENDSLRVMAEINKKWSDRRMAQATGFTPARY